MNNYKLSSYDTYNIQPYMRDIDYLFKYNKHIFYIGPKSNVIWMFESDAWYVILPESIPAPIMGACLAWSHSNFSKLMPISEFLNKTLSDIKTTLNE